MTNYFNETLRLYKTTKTGILFYWLFSNESTTFVDYGNVGEIGERIEYKWFRKTQADKLISQLFDDGFSELDESTLHHMDIVFQIEADFANSEELSRRNAHLEDVDAFLAFTGQGFVTGASSGSGTMEIGLAVISSDIAIKSITYWLTEQKITDFSVVPL